MLLVCRPFWLTGYVYPDSSFHSGNLIQGTPMPITIKAIYEVKATAEAANGQVWIGRLLSSDYHFYLRHW